MKKIVLFAIILVLLYIVFWMIYKFKVSVANEEWYQKRYVDQEINGVLKSITEHSDNRYSVILVIKNTIDQTELTYGPICLNKEYRDYIFVGDSIYKQKRNKTLRFCKSKIDCKELELNFCE